MGKVIDLTGQRFGWLVVLSRAPDSGSPGARWNCVCDYDGCGNHKIVRAGNLKSGTRSCGCYSRERSIAAATHGHSKSHNGLPSRTYRSWMAMRRRCHYPKSSFFSYYGGRGITVCERWRDSFENFLEDMGERPEGKTLDRIDNNGNYEPNNCRWATPKEQIANRKRAVRCRNGHLRTDDNTYTDDNGYWRCRVCIEDARQRRRENYRAAA